MSTAYSIAQRTSSLNGVFAALACAVALTLTAGPALAQSGNLGRVEISGRIIEAPTRLDVLASCPRAATQLQDDLEKTWAHERSYGSVDVRFVVDGGEVTGVHARGISMPVSRAVRQAVGKMECASAGSGTYIYKMQVVFVDPYAPQNRTVASAGSPYRIALVETP